MVYKNLLFVAASSICTISCMNEPLVETERVIPQSVYFVSQIEAIEVAQRFLSKSFEQRSVKSNASVDKYFVPMLDGETPYAYIVNFTDGGLAIIAADRRMNPILAYSEIGSISDDSSDYPAGFQIWLEGIKADFKSIKEGSCDEESTLKNSLMWDKLLTRIGTRSIPMDTTLPDPIDTTVGPLLSTTWYQNDPFNSYLPPSIDSTGIVLEHALAGSSTVAIARLMHYYQSPSSFSWNNMPLSISSSDTTNHSSLFGLYYDIYTKQNMSSSGSGSYVHEVFHLDSFLKNEFGYTSATQISYNRLADYPIVKSELLDHSRPVIFSGNLDHSSIRREYWVCDGVHKYEERVYDINGHPGLLGHLYFHHSWMSLMFPPIWLGFSNFTAGTAGFTPYSYTINMRLVYQIVP